MNPPPASDECIAGLFGVPPLGRLPLSSIKPDTVSDQQELNEVRKRLLQILSLRAQPPADSQAAAREDARPTGEVREGAVPPAPTTSDIPPAPTPEHEGGLGSPPSRQTIQQCINPAALLADLRDVITRYVVLPEMAAEALALWVVHTYAFTLRQITTYIGVVSPEKRCGKTTLLELLGRLAHEAITAANISPSALFRVIEEKQPTLIIDEADTFLEGRDEMAGILNAGYRKGNAFVMRVSEAKRRKNGLTRYSCWCPKVMAAIGRLPETLADRCILITMQRKMPGEKCDRLRELDATQYQQRCAEFVQQHRDAIATARPEIPTVLNDRAADIWEPLLAIADLAGGDWPGLARQAAHKLSLADDDIPLIGYFLSDLRNWMLIRKTDRILSRDIVATFNRLHDRPWQDLRRGRQINEYWLAAKMRELGIRPKHLRFGDSIGRGYVIEDIESALRRYIPNPELHSTQPPSTASPTG
jgi:putative DNA primase/helicase